MVWLTAGPSRLVTVTATLIWVGLTPGGLPGGDTHPRDPPAGPEEAEPELEPVALSPLLPEPPEELPGPAALPEATAIPPTDAEEGWTPAPPAPPGGD